VRISMIGGGVGSVISAISIAPLYLFVSSLGIIPDSFWRNLFIYSILCTPLAFIGCIFRRHDRPGRENRFHRIIPFCVGAAVAGALLCAIPAFVTFGSKTDASIVFFLSLGWLSGMQGAFFFQLFRVMPQKFEPDPATVGPIEPILLP